MSCRSAVRCQACGEAGRTFLHCLSMSDLSLGTRLPESPLRATTAAACAVLLGLPLGVAAQTTAPAEVSLPAVVVTATRTPVQVDRTIADVTVLTAEDLAVQSGRTLTEVLAQQAGLQFTSNGGLGKSSALFVRGLGATHVLLLVDGVRYGSATTGQADFDNLPLGDIDHIEIVRGPMASLYGSDAVGGVVQVFTRRAKAGQGVRGNGALTAGSHGYAQGSGGLSFDDGLWNGAVQLVHTENRGFSSTNERTNVRYGPYSADYNADRDGFNQKAGSVQLGLRLPQGWQINTRLLQSEARTGYDDGEGATALARLRAQVASVDVAGQVTPGWNTQLRVARSANDYETLAAAASWAELGTIATVQQQLSWDNTFALPVGSLLVVAEHLTQKVSKPADNYDVTERTIRSAALGYNAAVGAHTVQASVRHDANSQYGDQTTGNLGYGYALTPALRLTAQAGTSFVAPSFNQLYWPSYGNSLLEPETGKHAEIGLRYVLGAHQLSATVFGNRIRGYITAGSNPVNLPYAQSHGVTLAYDGRIGPVRLAAAVDHMNPRNDTEGSANQGKLLPRRARNDAKLSADVELGAWTVGSALQAYSHRFDDAANTFRLAGYAVADLHAQWQFQRDWSLAARLNNVFDRQYETAWGYNQPGRELYVTLRYSPR
ncbi:MAG: vitamin transporter [Pseudomonadota bacterium]|nr:vitamin transporter [Pseudomonadota bacterium]